MADRYARLRNKLPPSYVKFMESRDGWAGDLGDELGYVDVWSRDRVQENWRGYQMANRLSDRWFAFGSDGGGEMLCFDLESESDAIFWINFISMSDEDALKQPFSFADVAAAIGGIEP